MQQVRESNALDFFAAHRTRPYETALRKQGNKLVWMRGEKGDKVSNTAQSDAALQKKKRANYALEIEIWKILGK